MSLFAELFIQHAWPATQKHWMRMLPMISLLRIMKRNGLVRTTELPLFMNPRITNGTDCAESIRTLVWAVLALMLHHSNMMSRLHWKQGEGMSAAPLHYQPPCGVGASSLSSPAALREAQNSAGTG